MRLTGSVIAFLFVCLNPALAQTPPPVSFNAGRIFDAGTNPRSVAVGDFNGDGHADLAVAGANGGVNVLLGNGDGTFEAAVSYAAGTNPFSVAVGDGDGYAELAAHFNLP